jgi:DNA repair ATPase RecN
MLADKDFHKSAPVDILLGAEIFFEISMQGRHECKGLPLLQNTKLGYVLSGKTHQCYVKKYKNQCHSVFVQTDYLQNMIERFWSIEEMNKVMTPEEKACEEHFQRHTKRLETGRYKVRLPLSDSVDQLAESYDNARTKFLALEQRLMKHPQLKQDYSAFIEEYL